MKRTLALTIAVGIAASAAISHAAELEKAAEVVAPKASAPSAVSQPAASDKCEVALGGKTRYVPMGYVSGALVNRFSNKTPLLFTELYFRALGMALHKQGFEKIVNSKGVFQEQISQEQQQRALNIVGGESDANIQTQGLIATEIWNTLVEAFKLKEVRKESDAVQDAKKAYYTNVDDYIATHDFLLANIGYKREVIELIRLSLPFGIRMAVDGVARDNRRATFVTGVTVAGVGIVSYAALQFWSMLGTPDPGLTPMIVPAILAPVSGAATYLYTAPKTNLRKLHLWYMNWANKRSLMKRGLLSKEDGESSIFIRESFRDLTDLRNEVNVADIKGVLPLLPTSTKLADVEKAMMTYADQLGTQMTSVSAFQEMVSKELQRHTKTMGEPISTLARLLQMKGNDTAHAVPDNARHAIDGYKTNVVEAFERYTEIEAEFAALEEQYTMHEQVLEAFLNSGKGQFDTHAQEAIERKLRDLRNGVVTVKTLRNVARTQVETLSNDKTALDKALLAIAAVQGNKALDASELTRALWSLANRVGEVTAEDIKDGEKIPTGEQK